MGSSSYTVALILLVPGGVRLWHSQLYGATLRYSSLRSIVSWIKLFTPILNVTGKSECKDVVGYLSNLENEENNVVKVLHDSDVSAIFVQLDKQRRLPKTWEVV